MRVKEMMTGNATACTPTATLADAAGFMWENDCGVLPVVTDEGKVVGLITDRDICMAAALNNRNLSNIAVEEVVSGKVYSVAPEDDIHKALETMQACKVRRLAVVNEDGTLEGILSMNDIVLQAQEAKDKRGSGVGYAEIVEAYKAICAHRQPAKQELAAGAGV